MQVAARARLRGRDRRGRARIGTCDNPSVTTEDDRKAAGGWFPSTRPSAVLAIRSTDPDVRARSHETLALVYWRPVYKHVRLRCRKSPEEASDLTQGFFLRALEKRTFEAYDPPRGRFRTFVRTCLERFVINEDKAARRIKRGGASEQTSFDFGEVETEMLRSGGSDDYPDTVFEREWVRGLVAASMKTLGDELRARGKGPQFQVFERFALADEDHKPSYADVARELRISVATVTNYLNFARREMRKVMLENLRELTATEEEFEMEAREVLGVETREVIVR
jgi:RNA polymerase sigma factor (sigma-70 family)